MIKEQEQFLKELDKLVSIFEASEAELRPHFILTGPSGSGKSFNIAQIAEKFDLGFLEINAAQLTKEGTSGNSLSKAMAPLANMQQDLTICFVDEFDKLFVSGNSNSQMAHESTNGVQNEFLKVLESDTASVFGDYGKYVNISVKKVLFVFAGAFNGEEDIDIDRLREIGIKTEFLGRVGLVFNTSKVSLESMVLTMKASAQLDMYLKLFSDVKRERVEKIIEKQLTEAYEKNTLGFRLITTLINQYFIKGEDSSGKETKKVSFQRTLQMT
jgi:ATP-dependent protease Clp ATPase subunit